ncbi:hypothetical protein GNT65_02105 [Shewanella sp. JBTF-M18]|uniref:Catalase n=1 Tax=Shewanella insulae TaxID=2681496 RepID=A0A6L7HT57_9GAMM|nr:hypothetical protein [Shewanella insulae]
MAGAMTTPSLAAMRYSALPFSSASISTSSSSSSASLPSSNRASSSVGAASTPAVSHLPANTSLKANSAASLPTPPAVTGVFSSNKVASDLSTESGASRPIFNGSSSVQGGYSLSSGPLGIGGLLNRVAVTGLGKDGVADTALPGVGAGLTGSDLAPGSGASDGVSNAITSGAQTGEADVSRGIVTGGEQPVADIFGGAEEIRGEAYNPFADKQEGKAAPGDERRSQDPDLARQEAELKELSRRDAEVRAHEQAHASVGGTFARSPSFKYEQGSDGRRYAVDGEVAIDISTVPGDPLATLNKMKQVYAAAMAPVTPSMADIRVASEALRKMNTAKAELAKVRQQSAITPEQMQPLIDAGKSDQQRRLPETVSPRVSGSVDDQGRISAARIDSPSALDNDRSPSRSIEQISRQLLVAEGLVFTPKALSMRYQVGEGESSPSSLAFFL